MSIDHNTKFWGVCVQIFGAFCQATASCQLLFSVFGLGLYLVQDCNFLITVEQAAAVFVG